MEETWLIDMKKSDISKSENYLDRIPVHNPSYRWTKSDDGKVTLEIDNKGFFNRIAQKLFKKPPVTYIHLDDMGSFVWPLIDGKRNITSIAEDVDTHFGEAAHPLYERLAKFFQILSSYGFITFR